MISEVYQLPVEYRKMLEGVDWNGEIRTVDFIDEVDVGDEKPFHIGRLIKACTSEIDIIKDEIDRLRHLKATAEMNLQQLRQYLTMLMLTLDQKHFDNGVMKISLRNTNPKLVIEDEDFIPDEFIKTETVIQKVIDKDELKRQIKEGREIAGIYFLQDQTVVVK